MDDPQPPEPPKSVRIDPLLESLLAKARPIIAEERGLNHRSRVKIQALGKKMKIPAAVVDQALQLLHGAPPIQRANDGNGTETHYEKEFARVMSRKVARISGRIMTTKIEEKAISIGTRKYQLSETQARNIIRQVADDLGIPRVTLTEAERHIEQEVADVIADQTWITGEKKERLIRNGKRLGVTREQIESMIQRHLQFNFQQARFEQKLTDRLWVVAACIVVGTGLALFVFFQMKQARQENDAIVDRRKEEKRKIKDQDDATASSQSPDWWDDALKVELQKTRLKVNGFPAIHDALRNNSSVKRAKAYQEIFELGSGNVNPDVVRQRVSRVIPALFKSDPSLEALQGMLRGFGRSIKMPAGSIPASIDFFKRAFWALDLLNQLVGLESMPDDKIVAIQQLIESITEKKFDLFLSTQLRLAKQKRALIESYFKQFADIGDSAPELAPQVFEQLEELVSDDLPVARLQELRYRFLGSMLRADEANWQFAAGLLRKTVEEANDDQLIYFIGLMETTELEPLQIFLAESLATKAGLVEEVTSVEELAEKLREYFELETVEEAKDAETRKEQLEQKLLDFHNRWAVRSGPLNKKEAAQLLVESVYLTTLVWLVDTPEAAMLDPLLEQGFPRLDDTEYIARIQGWSVGDSSEPDESTTEGGRSKSGNSAAERHARQQMKRAFELLNQYQILQPNQRMNAFGQIQRWSEQRQILDPGEARILAEYLLARKREDEQQKVLQAIPDMRHWPRLLIAVADLLQPDPASGKNRALLRDTCLDVASQLLERDLRIVGENWNDELADQLLVTAQELLRDRVPVLSGETEVDQIKILKSMIDFFYRLRVQSTLSSRPVPPQRDLDSSLDFLIEHYRRKLLSQNNRRALDQMQKNGLIDDAFNSDPLSRFYLKQRSLLIGVTAQPGAAPQPGVESMAVTRLAQMAQTRLPEVSSVIGQIAENEIRMLLNYYLLKLK